MRNLIPNRKEKGFTLIELVMVIVILGILAAFALPRFADFGGDARVASMQGLAGALKSASSIAHARQVADSAGLGDSVSLDGIEVLMVNGYPRANAEGILKAAAVDAGNDYDVSGGGAAGGAVLTLKVKDFSGANCEVTYTAATAGTDNTSPITAAPVVSIDTDGC